MKIRKSLRMYHATLGCSGMHDVNSIPDITKYEKNNYVFNEPRDYKILIKIKELERKKLTKSDKEIVKLIRTQLKDDWRADLINYLNKLSTKYKK